LTASLWRNCQPNISLLFGELAFARRPQAAARAGFDAIECWWPFATAVPSDRDLDAFVRSVTEAGVQLRALNFFAGDMPAGERGIASDPRRGEEFAAAVDAAVEIGGRLRVPLFNALYGNRLPGLRAEEQDAAAVDALAGAAQAVAAIGAGILIEPISGVAAYPVRRADDALRVMAAVNDASGAGNCRLLADLYHLYVNGDEVDRVIAEQAGRIGHVQLADAPGRREPGTGAAPLLDWVEALAAAGYEGAIGLEYIPFGDTVSGLQWLMELNPAIGRAAAVAGEGGR
jgi:hydroxypyruvate isomerase